MLGQAVLRRSARLERELADTRFERVLANASQIGLVLIAAVVALAALQIGQFILAPVSIAMLVGLMAGPLAEIMEKRGVASPLAAGAVVLVLLLALLLAAFLFAAPLSGWVTRVPLIWGKLSQELATLRGPLEAVGAIETQLRSVFGDDSSLTVTVADGGPVTNAALLAPALLGQFVIFLGGLYFFLTARHELRTGLLSLCYTRRLRWRVAHVFRDVEHKVSRYLLTITLVNLGLGTLVGLAMWGAGMPSPLLWGALAFVLNYIPFVGQAVTLALIFLIGLGTRAGLTDALIPAALYWGLSFAESQVVTPNLLGRAMTINPFMIFLSLAFWLWAWGPVGGLVAVPSVLVLHSLLTHILPARMPTPHHLRPAAKPDPKLPPPKAGPRRKVAIAASP